MVADARQALGRMLGLNQEAVALRWFPQIPQDLPKLEKKARFCGKLNLASHGQTFYAGADEEECMGGAKYCGLRDGRDFPANRRSGEFLVGMGIYRDVAAVQRAWQGNLIIEPGIFKALAFAPLSSAAFEPDVVFVLCNARQGMQLLHANAFEAGARAIGADAGPICSTMAAIPYLTGKVTYGFGDVGARPYMKLGADTVMVSIPGSELGRIASSLEKMIARNAFHD